MTLQQTFSRRNHYGGATKEITIREDAPEGLRVAVLETARDLDWTPSALREVLCSVLRVRPNGNNWSNYPNIWHEVQDLTYGCEWFKVYDIIEALYTRIARNDEEIGEGNALRFVDTLNAVFVEDGIGWQIAGGKIVTRGTETFEANVTTAISALEASDRPTAAKRLHEALHGLSRRPQPDLPGAVFHAMGALECVARDLTGDVKATLGQVLNRHPGLVPPPLDTALSQIWGYASEQARHVREGREIDRVEAELLVGLAASAVTYLTRKQS